MHYMKQWRHDSSARVYFLERPTSRREYLMKVVKFSDAKNQLEDLLDKVENDQGCTVISRRGAGDAVVMPMGYFKSLMETIYLLKSPANSAHLDKSIRQHQSGETVSRELPEE